MNLKDIKDLKVLKERGRHGRQAGRPREVLLKEFSR